MKTPPSRGPATDAIPHMQPNIPNMRGSRRRGRVYDKMTTEPENKPALPIPATARPMMKAVEDGAMAETKLPSSKSAIAPRNEYLMSKIRYILPYNGCSAVEVKRYELPYQPISPTLPYSLVMAPSAGAIIV